MQQYEELKKITNELLYKYEKSETLCILFYSTNKNRDFKILNEKIQEFKKRILLQDIEKEIREELEEST